MRIEIDSYELAEIIYNCFVGDCECNTECYKYCNDENCHSCVDSIEKRLIEKIEIIKK